MLKVFFFLDEGLMGNGWSFFGGVIFGHFIEFLEIALISFTSRLSFESLCAD